MSDNFMPRRLNKPAVYWAPAGMDAYGVPTFESPLQILCRWEDRVERYIRPDGTEHSSQCMVDPDRDLLIGGMLKLGTLELVDDVLEPRNNAGAYEIMAWEKIPNIRGNKYVRTAIL